MDTELPVFLAFLACYGWLGVMHWERMLLLDPEGRRCEVERAWRERETSVLVLFGVFVFLWPFFLAVGSIFAAIERRRG